MVERAAATSIYYLLHAGERSRFHRIASDELWLWQGGGVMDVYVLADGAPPYVMRIGPPGREGANGQGVVPAGAWFAASPAPGSDHVLVACAVAPGFDFADFELADRDLLRAERPDAGPWIERFT
jgi:predicted cupin superfamily sugar epimerase